jgi:hypothetical protein
MGSFEVVVATGRHAESGCVHVEDKWYEGEIGTCMVQKVTIITDASVALKPLVESAIQCQLHDHTLLEAPAKRNETVTPAYPGPCSGAGAVVQRT